MDYYLLESAYIYNMITKNHPPFSHFVIEVKTSGDINSIEWIRDKATLLLNLLQIKSIKEIFHEFTPQGISLVNILSSSHMAIHSWPEDQYLHIDLVICARDINKNKVKAIAQKVFLKSKIIVHELSY